LADQTKQALFVKTRNIGDSIILTASISALPKEYRYVDIVCFPESAPIFEMNKRVRNIFIIPRDKRGIKKIMAYISLFKKLFKEHYDVLAHFSYDWRGAVLSRLLNPEIKVSRKTHRRGYFWHNSFNFLAPILDHERPMAEQDVDLLRAANLYKKLIAPGYELNIHLTQKNKIKAWLTRHEISLKNKLVVIHASSRWKYKEMPMEIWAKIIDELKFDYNCFYEEKDAIGKRYRRQDALGTPFCITVDHESLENQTVTIRYRDTMVQERIPIAKIREILASEVTWSKLLA